MLHFTSQSAGVRHPPFSSLPVFALSSPPSETPFGDPGCPRGGSKQSGFFFCFPVFKKGAAWLAGKQAAGAWPANYINQANDPQSDTPKGARSLVLVMGPASRPSAVLSSATRRSAGTAASLLPVSSRSALLAAAPCTLKVLLHSRLKIASSWGTRLLAVTAAAPPRAATRAPTS